MTTVPWHRTASSWADADSAVALLAFSDPWARAWCDAVNASEAYRKAAASWEGSLALVMEEAAGAAARSRAVFADLMHGTCLAARAATSADLEMAAFVVSAPAPVWKAILDRRIEPIPALLRGQLRLARGNLVTLVRHVEAAQELVVAATRVATEFPEEWLPSV